MPSCNGGAGPDFTRPGNPCGEHSSAGSLTATHSIANARTDHDRAPNGDPGSHHGSHGAAHPSASHGNPGAPHAGTASASATG